MNDGQNQEAETLAEMAAEAAEDAANLASQAAEAIEGEPSAEVEAVEEVVEAAVEIASIEASRDVAIAEIHADVETARIEAEQDRETWLETRVQNLTEQMEMMGTQLAALLSIPQPSPGEPDQGTSPMTQTFIPDQPISIETEAAAESVAESPAAIEEAAPAPERRRRVAI